LTVLCDENTIYHFQIGAISNKYVIGPLEIIDLTKAKVRYKKMLNSNNIFFCSFQKFPTLSALIEYHLKSPIIFQEENNKGHSILLRLYSPIEVTQF